MSYTVVALLLLLCPSLCAYTDITMLNCPAQFDIAAYNTTSDTTAASLGPLVYAGFSGSSQTRVNEIVINGDTQQLDQY